MSAFWKNLCFPPKCAGCDALIAVSDWQSGEECFCPTCRAEWELAKLAPCSICGEAKMDCRCLPPQLKAAGVDALLKLTAYRQEASPSVANRLLFCLKDKHIVAYETFLAMQLLPLVRREIALWGWSCSDMILTHCPRSPAKVRQTGTDQAARLAKRLAELLELSYVPLLTRSEGVEQKTLGVKERCQQAQQIYRLRRNAEVHAKHVLLVDDIVTTGASMAACAKILFESGALSVLGIAVEQVERKTYKNPKST